MSESQHDKQRADEIWRVYLNTGRPPADLHVPWYVKPSAQNWLRRLPSDPRCRLCYAPFSGAGGKLVHLALGISRSRLNPQICDVCEGFVHTFQGGAEVEVTVLFADVRGSTALARRMPPADFSQLINRFFQAATGALHAHHGLVEKLIGDEVTGFFVSGISGPRHAHAALSAAQEILKATGHGAGSEPWIPVGIGLHTGPAFVGSVGADIVVLGDVPNTGAHLASSAKTGEIIASQTTVSHAAWDTTALQPCQLQLKGRNSPLPAWTIKVA